MAVLSNNVIAGASIADDAAGDDTYKIEKSLRCNFDDGGKLERGVTGGNTRKWTASWWMKRGEFIKDQRIFTKAGGGGGEFFFKMGESNNGTYPYKFFIRNNVGGTEYDAYTDMVFRDPTAWQHVVFNYDSANAIATERYRIYVNGVKHTFTYVHNDKCVQNGEAGWSSASSDMRVAGAFGGHLADVQFIDGLALSPAAFGSFDSTGNWNPKAFALPTPNDGTTWSSGTIVNEHSTYPVSKAFDGNIGSGNNYWAPASTDLSSFEPSNDIEFNTSLRIYADFDTRPASASDDPYMVVTTDTGGEHKIQGPGDNVYPEQTNMKWYTIQEGKGKLTKITNHHGSLGYWCRIHAIEVDGVILVDGKTDKTYAQEKAVSYLNDGTTFSSAQTYAFDGEVATDSGGSASFTGANGEYTITFPKTITVSSSLKLQMYASTSAFDTYCDIDINGTETTMSVDTNQGNQAGIYASNFTGDMTTLRVNAKGGANIGLAQVIVDGTILVNGAYDGVGPNGFHLKFNDTSSNAALGNNSILDSVNQPVQAGAILKVKTDNTDFDLDSGVNSDPDKSHLVLAIAGNTIADHSHTIKGSGSAVSLTSNGSIATSSAQSKFYGTSIYFDGSDDYIDTDATDTDANSKFCVEYWMRTDVLDGCRPFNGSDNLNGTAYLYTELLATGGLKCRQADLGIIEAAAGTISANTWHHIAYTYDGTTERLFIDGVLKASDTSGSWTPPSDMKFRLGADESNAASGKYKGYLQDARVYFGTAKYTAAFTPAPGNFTVNNLNAVTKSYSDNNQLLPDSDSDQTGVPSTGANASGAFDGDSSTNFAVERKDGTGTGNVGGVWTPNPKITGVTSLHFSGYQASNTEIRVNEGSWTAMSGLTGYSAGSNTAWLTCDSLITNSEITKIEFRRTSVSPNYGTNMAGIKINGTQLVNIGDADIDSLTDSPTNYGTDTGAGGEVRGNYCTWNPLMIGDSSTQTFSQGNLEWKNDGADAWTGGTLGVRSGSSTTDKWYWEIEIKHGTGGYGICNFNNKDGDHSDWGGGTDRARFYLSSNGKLANPAGGSDLTYGSNTTSAVGDVIGVALDLSPGGTSGKITFYKNGTSLGVAHTDIDTTRDWTPFISDYGSNPVGGVLNTGQRAFKYTIPAGHKALCTQNLDDTFSGDELNNPSKYFDILTWEGTGTTAQEVLGLGFQPDLVWLKNRDGSNSHFLYDAIRGNNSRIYTNLTSGEVTNDADAFDFKSTGIEVDENVTDGTNNEGDSFIGWCWDAGTSAATPSSSYDITPSGQWVNATAGFSITKYTLTGSSSISVPHALGAKPDFLLFKRLDSTSNWYVYTDIIDGSYDYAYMDSTNAFNNSSRTIYDNEKFYTNTDAGDYIAYTWTAIPGYSSFGKYTGNGDADGPFVYTGFRPRWVMVKVSSTTNSWVIVDSQRDSYNIVAQRLRADLNNSEDGQNAGDFLSNGFKLRTSTASIWNDSNETYIYAAFAEHPFKTARAR